MAIRNRKGQITVERKKYKDGIHIDLKYVPETVLTKCNLSGLYLFCKTSHFKNDLIIDETFEI